MSSTQHQLIKQCATRLRGIVEALDNIHDTSPHRWSTDLDDVHSSAESLLAMIEGQAPALDAQCLAGDGSLRHPCPAHIGPFDKLVGSPVHNESEPDLPPLDEHLAQVFETGMALSESVEQAGGDEREAAIAKFAETCPMTAESAAGGKSYDIELRRYYLLGWDDRAALAQPSTAQAEGAPVVGCLCGMPMTEGHHSPDGCCNLEEFAPNTAQSQAEGFTHFPELLESVQQMDAMLKAEAERPEVVAYFDRNYPSTGDAFIWSNYEGSPYEPVMTVAQHERIVEARWNRAMDLMGEHVARISDKLTAERDAALAEVDSLAVQVLKLGGTISFAHHRTDQAGQVPQAWLDVQAERRRQVENEGWTPEHDDEHSHGQMARAAACYALAGSSAPNDGTAALLVSLAWPWDEQWWKPTSARRDLVKACALGLAEIERLDRAAASQGGPRDA
ncbi:hypothetical protein [Pseudomonas aeruginosa]|uniref:hypothetical protein n=1 Tax=Pseudomonas aeruginosa TaxID=287 RepID=UPI0024B7EAE1|nr:hypothetical protein [Pseudomonas aeruginosa]MDI9716407.1 hypothetical protein [Pseudomonas aeruginosa]MDI9774491.1 hypothetical protein [Pseudomonas aeruginosa]